MIDLQLARTIAKPFSGSEDVPNLGYDLEKMTEESLQVLRDYTGLHVDSVPAAEIITRDEWVAMNLDSMKSIFEIVDKQMESKTTDKLENGSLSPVLRSLAKGMGGLLVSSEIALIYGFMSQRVLGQVEASIFLPSNDIRLVFIGQNLKNATDNMDIDAEEFYHWVVLHELTHVFQFAGVPWLTGHLREMMQSYLGELEARLDDTSLTKMPDIDQLQAAIKGGGIAALLQTPAQREQLERVQAVMALIEGYAEHVMDAAGDKILKDYGSLRNAMQRRRKERGGFEQLILKLLGMEMKMRQYEDGRNFCNHIVDYYDIDTLNLVWADPSHLPTAAEVADPGLWAARVAPGRTPKTIVQKPVFNFEEQLEEIDEQLETVEEEAIVAEEFGDEPEISLQAQEKLAEIEDEEYLRELIKGEPSRQLLLEMEAWLPRATEAGYVLSDGDRWIVTKVGRRRLVEILSA